jgi:hypothetical protein
MPASTADIALKAVSAWLISAVKDRADTARPDSERRDDLWRRAVGQVVARLADIAELTHAGLHEIREHGMLLGVRLIRPPRSPIFVPSYQPVRRRNEATRNALHSLAEAAALNRPLVTLAGIAPGRDRLMHAALAESPHGDRVRQSPEP